MGSITRNFANLITADGTSGIPDGTVTNADLAGSISTDKLAGNINFKNIIINGDMSIAQRGTSTTSISSGDTYNTVDRWNTQLASAGTWTQSQETDVPTGQGFTKSLKMDCTTANSSLSASSYLVIQGRFEGQNLQYLKKGTANAESLTLSFWVKSNKTGTYAAELRDADNSRHISKTYTINSANTWEKKTITYAGDTTGAFDNDNAQSLRLLFWLAAGTDYSSGTLATSWQSQTHTGDAVGNVNLADNTANEWYITGVQLEAGTTASDFEFLPFDVNLRRCERYYQRTYDLGVANGTALEGTSGAASSTTTASTGYAACQCRYSTRARTTPTITFYSGHTGTISKLSADATDGNGYVAGNGETGCYIQRSNDSAGTYNGANIQVHVIADAEL